MTHGIKTLGFAIHSAAQLLGGINPDRCRPVIENATGCVWWLNSIQDDEYIVRDLGGVQRTFHASDVSLPEFASTIPAVQLSTGKIIETFRHPAGYKYTPTLMTDSEWNEFCGLAKLWYVELDYDDIALRSSSLNGAG